MHQWICNTIVTVNGVFCNIFQGVSKEHAVLSVQKDGATIQDLASKNKSRLNKVWFTMSSTFDKIY